MKWPIGHRDELAAVDLRSLSDNELTDEAVRRSKPARMVDTDKERTGDRTDEGDDAVGRSKNTITVFRVVFDAAVAGTVRAVR